MRHLCTTLFIFLLSTGALLPTRACAQADEIQQLLLNVEKLNQLRSILTDMKQGYDILQKGYKAVTDISQGSFSLHEHFLEGLLTVNPNLLHYKRVSGIIASQQRLVLEYRSAYQLFRQHGRFSEAEMEYLGAVYAHVLAQSLRHLEELALALAPGTLRMSDDERLEAIDRSHAGIADKLAFIRHFNRQAKLLALQRAREQADISAIRQFYLLQP